MSELIYVQMPVGIRKKSISDQKMKDRIVKIVCDYYSVEMEQLKKTYRGKTVIFARMYIYWFMRELTDYTLVYIGAMFNRDHTTVMAGLATLRDLKSVDEKISETIEHLNNKINS